MLQQAMIKHKEVTKSGRKQVENETPEIGHDVEWDELPPDVILSPGRWVHVGCEEVGIRKGEYNVHGSLSAAVTEVGIHFTDFIYLWLSLDGSGDGPLYIWVLFYEVITSNRQFDGLVQERHNSSTSFLH